MSGPAAGGGPDAPDDAGRRVNVVIERALLACSRGSLRTADVPGLTVSDGPAGEEQNRAASWALRRVLGAKGAGPLGRAGRTALKAAGDGLASGGSVPSGAGPGWAEAAGAVLRWALAATGAADAVTCHVACVAFPRGAPGGEAAEAMAFPTAEEAVSWAEGAAARAGPGSGATWTVTPQRLEAGRAEAA